MEKTVTATNWVSACDMGLFGAGGPGGHRDQIPALGSSGVRPAAAQGIASLTDGKKRQIPGRPSEQGR